MASVSRGFPRLSPPHARFSVAVRSLFSFFSKTALFCRKTFHNDYRANRASAVYLLFSAGVESSCGDDSARHCASVSSETSSADERRSADCMDMSSGSRAVFGRGSRAYDSQFPMRPRDRPDKSASCARVRPRSSRNCCKVVISKPINMNRTDNKRRF